MAIIGGMPGAAPTAQTNQLGFNRLAQMQAAQAPPAPRSPESVGLSPRARTEAVYDQTHGNWQQLSIPESRQLSAAERRAVENLDFLRNTARREDGGFTVPRGERETRVDTNGAFAALRDGRQVNYYESGGDEPVALHNFGEVADVTRDLKARIAQTQHAAGKR